MRLFFCIDLVLVALWSNEFLEASGTALVQSGVEGRKSDEQEPDLPGSDWLRNYIDYAQVLLANNNSNNNSKAYLLPVV